MKAVRLCPVSQRGRIHPTRRFALAGLNVAFDADCCPSPDDEGATGFDPERSSLPHWRAPAHAPEAVIHSGTESWQGRVASQACGCAAGLSLLRKAITQASRAMGN